MFHADAYVQALVELRDGIAHRERRAHGSLGVVLVGCRRAEHRHDGVADVLLDRPAEALEDRAQRLVVGGERPAHLLDVEQLAPAREADEVGEEHQHHLALLTPLDGDQRRAALHAEARRSRGISATRRAGRHQGDGTRISVQRSPARVEWIGPRRVSRLIVRS